MKKKLLSLLYLLVLAHGVMGQNPGSNASFNAASDFSLVSFATVTLGIDYSVGE